MPIVPYDSNQGADGDSDSDSTCAAEESATAAPVKNAWARLSTTIRKVDAEKVRDCKEDIDTILVFAGLYSAVLTALLVESYKGLQLDPQNTTVFLLQQLVRQTNSFVINDRFVNSTISNPSLTPPFSAPLNVQRVNILWFASLTISLISASFSIVVKQWLREFLAREHSSPRAHLRIRHFRNPGLRYYKVFEIAAFLPLLLQLSLLLFFVGLCFFTADVHESVGNTTLPLVAGWGFFFIATSLVPVADPTCPYKVPILKTPIRGLRRLWLKRSSRLRNARRGKKTVVSDKGPSASVEKDKDTHQGEQYPVGESDAAQSGRPSSGRWDGDADADSTIPNDDLHAQSMTSVEDRTSSHHTTVDGGSQRDKRSQRIAGEKEQSDFDEERVAHDEKDDVSILIESLEVDAVQADDQLLRDITREALRQASIEPDQLYQLPRAVLDYRMQPQTGEKLDTAILNMKSLSQQTYATIMHMFSLIVEEGMKKISSHKSPAQRNSTTHSLHDVNQTTHSASDVAFPSWLKNSICALLSDSDFPHSDTVNKILHSCFAPEHRHKMSKLIRSRFKGDQDTSVLAPILKRLKGGLMKESNTMILLDIIQDIFREFSTPLSSEDRKPPTHRRYLAYHDSCMEILHELLVPRITRETYDENDLDAILLVDRILLDDDLILRTITNILADPELKPSTSNRVSMLLFDIIDNRTQASTKADVAKSFLDLTVLKRDRYVTVMKLAAKIVSLKIDRRGTSTQSPLAVAFNTVSSDEALGRVICVLFSKGGNDSDEMDGINRIEEVDEALRDCLSNGNQLHTAKLITSRFNYPLNNSQKDLDFEHLLRRLKGGCAKVERAEDLVGFIQQLFPPSSDPNSITVTIRKTIDRQSNKGEDTTTFKFSIPKDYRTLVIDLIVSPIRAKTAMNQPSSGQLLLLEVLFQLSSDSEGLPKKSQMKDVVALMRPLLISKPPENCKDVYDLTLNTTRSSKKTRDEAQRFFIEATISADVEDLEGILSSMYSYYLPMGGAAPDSLGIAPRPQEGYTSAVQSIDLDSFSTCRFYLRLLHKGPPVDHLRRKSYLQKWKQLFDQLLSSLKKHSEPGGYRPAQYKSMAQESLKIIPDIRADFNRRNLTLPFSKDFISVLESIDRGPVPLPGLLNDAIRSYGRSIAGTPEGDRGRQSPSLSLDYRTIETHPSKEVQPLNSATVPQNATMHTSNTSSERNPDGNDG